MVANVTPKVLNDRDVDEKLEVQFGSETIKEDIELLVVEIFTP